MTRRTRTAARVPNPDNGRGPFCIWCHRPMDDATPFRSDYPKIPGARDRVCGFECPALPIGRHVYDLREPRPEYVHRFPPKVSSEVKELKPGRGRMGRMGNGIPEPAPASTRPGRGRLARRNSEPA